MKLHVDRIQRKKEKQIGRKERKKKCKKKTTKQINTLLMYNAYRHESYHYYLVHNDINTIQLTFDVCYSGLSP